MSPTDKGANTPESPETPEPNGEPIPSEAAPVEPIAEEAPAAEVPAAEVPATEISMAKAPAAEIPAAEIPTEPTYGEAPLAGSAPIEYPAPGSFASAQAPASSNKKVLAIVGGIVAAIVIVGVVLAVVLWPSNSDSSADAQIKQVTQDYVDAFNAGQLTKVPALMCKAQADQVPPNITDQEPSAQQAQIDSFTEIKVDGDKATATFIISGKDDDTIPPETVPMNYVNENGWKLCQQQ